MNGNLPAKLTTIQSVTSQVGNEIAHQLQLEKKSYIVENSSKPSYLNRTLNLFQR